MKIKIIENHRFFDEHEPKYKKGDIVHGELFDNITIDDGFPYNDLNNVGKLLDEYVEVIEDEKGYEEYNVVRIFEFDDEKINEILKIIDGYEYEVE